MTAPPGSLCCRTVELAVRVLPADHRQRYGLEFIAELYGMPKAQQCRHAARVLTSAWACAPPSRSRCLERTGTEP